MSNTVFEHVSLEFLLNCFLSFLSYFLFFLFICMFFVLSTIIFIGFSGSGSSPCVTFAYWHKVNMLNLKTINFAHLLNIVVSSELLLWWKIKQ